MILRFLKLTFGFFVCVAALAFFDLLPKIDLLKVNHYEDFVPSPHLTARPAQITAKPPPPKEPEMTQESLSSEERESALAEFFRLKDRSKEAEVAASEEVPLSVHEAEPEVSYAAEEDPLPEQAPSQETATLFPPFEPPPLKPKCSYVFMPQLVTIRHVEGINDQDSNFPLATNYSSLTIQLSPSYCLGAFLPMFDLRGHRFDSTSYAANVGFVGRFIPKSDDNLCKILGFNVYYDYRQSCIGYFQQAGAGLEVLGSRWDVRGNVYVPFGPKQVSRSCVFDDYIGDFFFEEEIVESVSYAFNAEVGYYLYYGEEFSLYLAGGPYYIAGRKCTDKTRGGELRIRPQYRDYLSLDFSVQYDSLFKTVWQGEITLNLPLYTLKNQNLRPCQFTDWQIYQPVVRFETMPVTMKRCFHSNF